MSREDGITPREVAVVFFAVSAAIALALAVGVAAWIGFDVYAGRTVPIEKRWVVAGSFGWFLVAQVLTQPGGVLDYFGRSGWRSRP